MVCWLEEYIGIDAVGESYRPNTFCSNTFPDARVCNIHPYFQSHIMKHKKVLKPDWFFVVVVSGINTSNNTKHSVNWMNYRLSALNCMKIYIFHIMKLRLLLYLCSYLCVYFKGCFLKQIPHLSWAAAPPTSFPSNSLHSSDHCRCYNHSR